MFIVESRPADTVFIDLGGVNILSADDARKLVKSVNVALGDKDEIEHLRCTLRRLLTQLANEHHPVLILSGRGGHGYLSHLPSHEDGDGQVYVQPVPRGFNVQYHIDDLALVTELPE